MDKWCGKIAVITGASSGIGFEILRDLAYHGITVVGLARRSERIENAAKELKNDKIFAVKCDVSDQESLKSAFKWIEEKFGFIHILINNAGISLYEKILNPSDEITDRINQLIDTNLKGLVHATREGVKLINSSKDYGIIINVSSILDSAIPFPNPSSLYPATKIAVKAFTEIIRQELIVINNDKIRISNVSPGAVKTEIGHAAGRENPDEYYKFQPHLQPKDISDVVLYLLSTPFTVNVTQITIKPVNEKF